VPANQQLVGLTTEFFAGSPDPATVGWFQVTSPTEDLTGFFLFVNGAVTEFDGADLPGPFGPSQVGADPYIDHEAPNTKGVTRV
jgi:hypothetical protein